MFGMESADGSKRAVYSCYIAGALFAIGWWLLADAAIWARWAGQPQQVEFVYLLPAFGSTFGLWFLNAFPWSAMSNPMDEVSNRKAKCFMFTALIASFGSLFGSVWILMDVYTSSKGRDRGLDAYPGAMIVVQNVLIFIAACVLRFGRVTDGTIC